MTFLAPYALAGVALVSLPLLIHLLVRRRGRPLDFPSLRFLRETPSFRLSPRRLRRPLLLALRASAIVLLAAGLARPLLTYSTGRPAAARFILIDASLSMKARGRAEAARERARAIVNKLGEGERAAVISLSSGAEVLAELTDDRERLLRAIERYRPAGGPVDYGAGFAEVLRQLRSGPRFEAAADLVSDFQQAGLDGQGAAAPAWLAQFRVNAHPVGAEIERNAFVIDEAAARGRGGLSLSATEIVSERGGRRGARAAWTINEPEGSRSGLEWRTEANGQITGRVTALGPDDFDADDGRFFAFAPPRERRVLLVGDDADATLYMRAALEAGGSEAHGFALDVRPVVPESASELSAYSLVVLTLRGAPRGAEVRALGEYARAGGAVWMLMGRDLDAPAWGALARAEAGQVLPFESVERRGAGRPLSFGAMDTGAPQLRGLDESAVAALREVRSGEVFKIEPRASADTLIRWDDGTPAFVYARAGAGAVMLLATSAGRESGDLGLSPAFPALVSSVVNAAVGPGEPFSLSIGEAVGLGVAPGTDVKVVSADGRARQAKARDLARRPQDYFGEPGIYRLEFAGAQKFVAFNAPASESERALATSEEIERRFRAEGAGADAAGVRLDAAERRGSTWRYFLAAAFLLMLAELFVATGRRKELGQSGG